MVDKKSIKPAAQILRFVLGFDPSRRAFIALKDVCGTPVVKLDAFKDRSAGTFWSVLKTVESIQKNVPPTIDGQSELPQGGFWVDENPLLMCMLLGMGLLLDSKGEQIRKYTGIGKIRLLTSKADSTSVVCEPVLYYRNKNHHAPLLLAQNMALFRNEAIEIRPIGDHYLDLGFRPTVLDQVDLELYLAVLTVQFHHVAFHSRGVKLPWKSSEWKQTILKTPDHADFGDSLMQRSGLFFLEDVLEAVGGSKETILSHADRLNLTGIDPWKIMGIRKVLNRWIVRMTTFAEFLQQVMPLRWQAIPSDWDGNRLLSGKGVFLLGHVASRIPFKTAQLRHQAKKYRDAKQRMGVWKDSASGLYLVDMTVFGPWIKRVWRDI